MTVVGRFVAGRVYHGRTALRSVDGVTTIVAEVPMHLAVDCGSCEEPGCGYQIRDVRDPDIGVVARPVPCGCDCHEAES